MSTLGNRQSKDEQDIFLDKNDEKDADEIIKAMTPKTLTQEQTKLLDIHNKTNHCVPIKETTRKLVVVRMQVWT